MRPSHTAYTMVCFLLAAGCGFTAARPPALPPADAPIESRTQAFAQYRLTEHGNAVFGRTWSRNDGEYTYSQVEPLLAAYPATASIPDRARTRGWVVNIPAFAAGGLVGWAAADQLLFDDIDGDTRTALYLTGGGLLITSIVLALVWDPSTDVESLYNASMSRQLGLPGTGSTRAATPN